MRSLFPDEFRGLPRDCVERLWDKLLDTACAVYLPREEFDAVFGVVDKEVKIFTDAPATQVGRAKQLESDALQRLFVLFELPLKAGYVDCFEVLGAIILSSDQLSRREKHLLVRERCLLFSELNVASVINGASLALGDRRVLDTDELRTTCRAKDIDAWADKFPHRKIDIRVQITKTGQDVVENSLKVVVGGVAKAFDKDGVAVVHAESNSEATLGSWKLRLKTGYHRLRGKTEFDEAEVRVLELDGLNEHGDADAEDPESDDEEVRAFHRSMDEDIDVLQEEDGVEDTAIPQLPPCADEFVLETCYGRDNDVPVVQIASGEVVHVAGRFAIVEDLLHIREGDARRVFPLHSAKITALEVHPNGRNMISAQEDSHKLLVWDSQKLQLLHALDTVLRGARCLSICKSGKTLFMLDTDRVFAFYDVSSFERPSLVRAGRLPGDLQVARAEMIMSDQVLLAGSEVCRLKLDGTLVRMRWGKKAPKAAQDSVAVIYGSSTCVTSSQESGAVYLWDGETCIKHVELEDGLKVCSVAFTGLDSVACGLSNGTIRSLAAKSLVPLRTNEIERLGAAAMSKPAREADPSRPAQIVDLHVGLSGLLATSSNGSLFWFPSNPTKQTPWELLKIGHGGRQVIRWCWCGPTMLATAGADRQVRVWRLPPSDEVRKEEAEQLAQAIKKGAPDAPYQAMRVQQHLVMSRAGLQGPVTAVAGNRSRVFVAMEGRKIQAVDIHRPDASTYDLIDCSLPVIDQMAASDNLVAACCLKAQVIEIRAFPSGMLVTKLPYSVSGVLLHDYGLRFESDCDGETALVFADHFAWDVKTWQPLHPGRPVPPAAARAYAPFVGTTGLVLLRKEEGPAPSASAAVQTQARPGFKRVCCLPSAPWSGPAAKHAVVAEDGKALRAVAVHPSHARGGIFAIATDEEFVQVNGYKLALDSPAQALAFGEDRLLAVCTAARLILFDWQCGVRLASALLAPETNTTASLAVSRVVRSPSDRVDMVARVNGIGNLEVWGIVGERLKLESDLSVSEADATSVTPSGNYGTSTGYIHNWISKREAQAKHPGGVLDLFEDRAGLVSGGSDGSVRAWSFALQQVALRPQDKTDFEKAVVSVFRTAASGGGSAIALRLADGTVFFDNAIVPPHEINAGLLLTKHRPFRFKANQGEPLDAAPESERTRVFKNSAGKKVFITKKQAVVEDMAESPFAFDDEVRMAQISANRKVIAVVSVCSDLYILDASTCLLVYFWPSSAIGFEVDTIQFAMQFIQRRAEVQAAQPRLGGPSNARPLGNSGTKQLENVLFEPLFVNGEEFVYKASS